MWLQNHLGGESFPLMSPDSVTDEQFAQLQQHWSDDEITEMLGVVAMFAFLNRWNDTMGTPLEASPAAVGAEACAAGKHG